MEMLPDGVRVVRRVRTSRDDAFDAWVNPARLKAWFGPPGTSVVSVDGELAIGGLYRLVLTDADGGTTELVWHFREIEPPERLVFGWQLAAGPQAGAGETVVTISFRAAGDWTEIELEHTGTRSESERETIRLGWDGCFDGLDEILN